MNGEYRLYYSATRDFGSSESRIWLAVSRDPMGPFENRGVAVDSWGTDDSLPNAIDPHVLHAEGGRDYLVYGSFFGGIYMKELCPEKLARKIQLFASFSPKDAPARSRPS